MPTAALGLAFAGTLLGRGLPLPVGLLFHVAWVTLLSVVYVVLLRDALTLVRAFWLAFGPWILVLLLFFPVVGWGAGCASTRDTREPRARRI